MEVTKAIRQYVERMIDAAPSGMKVLLLDKFTTPIISVVLPQSWLLSKEVYLVDLVSNLGGRSKMHYLKCICFLRPTAESVHDMARELSYPSFSDYYLYFSNTLQKSQIETLAEADVQESVRELQEYFGDFLALTYNTFSLSIPKCYDGGTDRWNQTALDRSVQGLTAVCAALKRRLVLRFERKSGMSTRLAQQVQFTINQTPQVFKPDWSPITLMILDRRLDPVTPLLTPWTYQAMVHELIGITNGRVDLSGVPDIKPDMKEVVFSPENDQFFAKNMYLSFGDLGLTVKNYVTDFQSTTNSTMSLDSISDMKRFVEQYPEFRKLSSQVSKHVTVIGELSRLVDVNKLLETGELEQNLACGTDRHASDLKNLRTVMEREDVSMEMKVKLCMLYTLRYENQSGGSIQEISSLLSRGGASQEQIDAIGGMITYGGKENRQDDLFSFQSLLSKSKFVLKGIKGVQNVYMQHTPLLHEIMDQLIKGKLPVEHYPFLDKAMNSVTKEREKVSEAIVFMVGGATYAEAGTLHALAQGTDTKLLLGGTNMLDSRSFMAEVKEAVQTADV